MYDDAEQLNGLIRHYLARDDERSRMAANAHRRAVPAYSLDGLRVQVLALFAETRARAATREEPVLKAAAE